MSHIQLHIDELCYIRRYTRYLQFLFRIIPSIVQAPRKLYVLPDPFILHFVLPGQLK
jgi:hypothetical protein